MELYTENIYLRPITEADTEMVLRWRNSEAVKQYFIYRQDITPAEHLNWLETKVKTGKVAQFIIYMRENDMPIGSVYMQSIDPVHKNAEYGIFIGEHVALGKGCGTDAAKLAIRFAFEELGLHKLYLRVISDNQRAIRSYEKAGFEIEGVLKDDIFVDGKFCDVTRMAIIREETV
ncbi:MAG: UDP-4-amino-4,6-dideoxy-N-acetyl-beta-L-altrosamine N-acetyltransferase [Ruminococcaceae bacterium]|nr:UDP-4-amino-4,6-dideoxy-N-acetyl-beta-L-altrosamine N-acetyltransferase [Oscillospiraceae bacterium]